MLIYVHICTIYVCFWETNTYQTSKVCSWWHEKQFLECLCGFLVIWHWANGWHWASIRFLLEKKIVTSLGKRWLWSLWDSKKASPAEWGSQALLATRDRPALDPGMGHLPLEPFCPEAWLDCEPASIWVSVYAGQSPLSHMPNVLVVS